MGHRSGRKNAGRRILAVCVLIVAVALYLFIFIISIDYNNKYNEIADDIVTPIPTQTAEFGDTQDTEDILSDHISGDMLVSNNAILVSLKDNNILMQKNAEEIIYPASLTKIMTAIIAIENTNNLYDEVVLDSSIFQELYEANASMAGFQPDERVKAIDLLYGALLPSGADSCIGLAVWIAGSEQDYVEIMNQKAAELDMTDTHFENTTGLHDDNHYTTVRDIAVQLRYALQNDIFREIFTSSRHSIPPTNKHPDGITLSSTLFDKLNDQSIIDGEIMGGKTGYTDKAGLCLASLAKVDGMEYILITAGAEGNHYSEQYNITDALAVYNSIGVQRQPDSRVALLRLL